MIKVKGNDIIVFIKQGDDYLPVACSTSCEITSTADLIETTTLTTGYWKEYDYQSASWQVTVDGVIIIDDEVTKLSLIPLLNLQHQFLSALFQCTISDGTNIKIFSGTVLIPSITFSGGVDDFGRHQETFQGSGTPVVSDFVGSPGGGGEDDPPTPTINVTLAVLDGFTDAVYIRAVELIDSGGNSNLILPGSLFEGQSQIIPITPGTYSVRLIANAISQADVFLESDALPGFDVNVLPGAERTIFAYPGPVFDFSTNRFIRLQVNA